MDSGFRRTLYMAVEAAFPTVWKAFSQGGLTAATATSRPYVLRSGKK